MKINAFVPTLPQISREAFVVIAGAIVAALVIGQTPALRDWIKAQWGGARPIDQPPQPPQY